MSMLPVYVQGWREAADAIVELTAHLSPEQWATPTDLPGWTVQDVVAHLGHLEAVLAGTVPDDAGDVNAGAVVSSYTEKGVEDRRGHTPEEVLTELREAIAVRADQLADLPEDPKEIAPRTPGGIGWNWDTLLRNRCIDMWTHEQDLRRALNQPGGLDGTAAQVTTMGLMFGMPFVLGKKVKPAPGSTVKWTVTGEVPAELAARVGDDGRAAKIDELDGTETELTMSTEAFHVLAAGRRPADQVDVEITGDQALGRAVLDNMAITP